VENPSTTWPDFDWLLALTPGPHEARTLGTGLLSDPIPLPDTGNELSHVTVAPGLGTDPVRLVFEVDDRPGSILNAEGQVVSTFDPLPGYADRSVATLNGWYRLNAFDDDHGRIEILDPATLQPGTPSREIPCGYPGTMSTARGRLLVVCTTGHIYAFASPRG
jgi:hypothetical protein